MSAKVPIYTKSFHNLVNFYSLPSAILRKNGQFLRLVVAIVVYLYAVLGIKLRSINAIVIAISCSVCMV